MGIEFKIVKELPNKKLMKSIEKSVKRFVVESNPEKTPWNDEGLYQQTLHTIAYAITTKESTPQFWMVEYHNEVLAYAVCHTSVDVDNSLCYWQTQAYVNKKVRHHKIVHLWKEQLFEEAKRLGCKHIIIPSSRETESYKRFLGEGWHTYVTLLKKDLK